MSDTQNHVARRPTSNAILAALYGTTGNARDRHRDVCRGVGAGTKLRCTSTFYGVFDADVLSYDPECGLPLKLEFTKADHGKVIERFHPGEFDKLEIL